MTPLPLGLVIFDCDGVLIDSEGPSNRVVAQEITRLGWPMTEAQSMALFVGHRLSDIPPVVQARLGRPVPDGWVEHLRACLIAAFETIQTIPGARETLLAVTAMDIPFRVASNSSHQEMEVKFHRTGLAELIGGRRHSARDVAHGKPAPDVFLAAAAAADVVPGACIVVEDSIPGIRAAVAAGMAVVALVHGDNAAALQAEGAITIDSLLDLPKLLQSALHRAA